MALPPIESLRHRLAAATDDEVHELVEECRQEVLAHLKQQLKERLLHTFLEEATQRLGLAPAVSDAAAAELDAETPAAPEPERAEEVLDAEPLADETFEIQEAYQASTNIDVTPPAEETTGEPVAAQPEADDPAPDETTSDAAEGWSYGDSSSSDAPAVPEAAEDTEEGSNAHIDEDILREIEAIRQQISKNEQLLSQLKPFFTESDDA